MASRSNRRPATSARSTEESYLTSTDVYNKIKENFPHYEDFGVHGRQPGTGQADVAGFGAAWHASTRCTARSGAKVMELFQMIHHLQHGTYVDLFAQQQDPQDRLPAGAV